MSTIDERVVEMRLENQQFEQNAKQSLSTLDKLKKAFNFDSANRGFKEINTAANTVSFKKVENGVDSLNNKFSFFGTFNRRIIENFADFAVSKMHQAVQAINTPINQIVNGGWSRATNIDQAKFQLKGLGVAWTDIADDIDYAVAGTAYGLDSAAKAASQLVASGVKFGQFGDDMKTALRGISGVAAMTNTSYEEISHIFTTVAGNGRLMTMQLNQLSERGLNAAAKLGDALGKSEAEIREMTSKGEIDFKTFAKAMDDAFGEHAKDANSTFEGSLANVKSALSKIGQKVAEVYRQQMIPVFNNVRQLINAIKVSLQPAIDSINKIIIISTGVLAEFIGKFWELNEDGDAVLKTALRFDDFVQGFVNMLKSLLYILYPIKQAFEETFGSASLNGIGKFNTAFKEFTEKLFISDKTAETIRSIFTSIFKVLKNIGIIAVRVGSALAKVFLPVAKIIGVVLEQLTDVLAKIVSSRAAAAVINILAKALNALVDGLIIGAEILEEIVESIADFIRQNDVLTKIFKVAETGLTIIFELLDKIFGSEFIQSSIELISTIVINAIDLIYEGLQKLFAFIESFDLKTVIDDISSWLGSLVSGLDELAGTALDSITKSIENLSDAIRGLFGKGGTTDDGSQEAVSQTLTLIEDIGAAAPVADRAFNFADTASNALTTLGVGMTNINGASVITLNTIKKVTAFVMATVTWFEGIVVAARLSQAVYDFGKASRTFSIAMNNFSKVVSPTRRLDSIANLLYNSKILQVAAVIGAIGLSLYALADIPLGSLLKAAAVLTGTIFVIGVMILVYNHFAKLETVQKKVQFARIAKSIALLSTALILIAASFKILDSIPLSWGLVGKIALMAGVMGELGGIAVLVGKVAKEFNFKSVLTILAIANSLLLICASIALLALIPIEKMPRVFGMMIVVFTGLAAVVAVASTVKSFAGAATIVAVALSLVGIATALLIFAFIPWDRIQSAIDQYGNVMLGLGTALFVSALIMDEVGNGVMKFGAGLALVTLSIIGFIALAKLCENLDLKAIGIAVAFMVGFGVLVVVLSKIAKGMSAINDQAKTLAKFGATMLMFSVSAALIALAVRALANSINSWGDLGALIVSVLAIGGLMVAFGYIIEQTSTISSAKVLPIIALIGTITVMVLEVIILSAFISQDPGSILAALAALGLISYALYQLLDVLADVVTSCEIKMGPLIAILGSLLIIGGTLVLLSYQPWEQVAAAGGAMAGALLAVAAALKIVGSMGDAANAKTALSLIVASAALLIIGGVLQQLALFTWEELWPAMAAMSVTILALGGALAIASIAGSSAAGALAVSGALLIASLSLIAIGHSLNMIKDIKWDEILPTLGIMAGCIVALIAAIMILGQPELIAIVGLGALAIAAIGALMYGLAWVFEQAAGFVGNGFEQLGQQLNSFADNLTAFANKISSIDAASIAVDLAMIYAALNAKAIDLNIGDSLIEATDKAIESVKGQRDKFYNAGVYLLEGFQEGLGGQEQATLLTKVTNTGNAIIDAFNDALGVASPSWKTAESADYALQGFGNNFTYDKVEPQVTGVADDILKEISSVSDGAYDAGADSMLELAGGINANGDIAVAAADSVTSAIKSKIADAWVSLSEVASANNSRLTGHSKKKSNEQILADNRTKKDAIMKDFKSSSTNTAASENWLEQMLDKYTAKAEEATTSTDLFGDSLGNLGDSANSASGSLKGAGGSAGSAASEVDNLNSSIENSIDLWNEYSYATDRAMDPNKAISNARKQLAEAGRVGRQAQILAAKGVSQTFLQYLMESGNESIRMTALKANWKQLQEMQDLYTQKSVAASQSAAMVTAAYAEAQQRDLLKAKAMQGDMAALAELSIVNLKAALLSVKEAGLEAYETVKQTIKDSLTSALDTFDKIDISYDKSASNIIENLKNNIKVANQYSNNMATVYQKYGMKIGDKLADMGFESGASYAAALANGSESEVSQILDLWTQLESVPDAASERVARSAQTAAEQAVLAAQSAVVQQLWGTETGNYIMNTAPQEIMAAMKTSLLEGPVNATGLGEESTKAILDAMVATAQDELYPYATEMGTTVPTNVEEAGLNSERGAEIGSNFTQGIISGMSSPDVVSALTNASGSLAQEVINAIIGPQAWDEHSPSKKAKQLAEYFGEGLVLGLGSKTGEVETAGAELALTANNAVNDATAVNPKISPEFDLTAFQEGLVIFTDLIKSQEEVIRTAIQETILLTAQGLLEYLTTLMEAFKETDFWIYLTTLLPQEVLTLIQTSILEGDLNLTLLAETFTQTMMDALNEFAETIMYPGVFFMAQHIVQSTQDGGLNYQSGFNIGSMYGQGIYDGLASWEGAIASMAAGLAELACSATAGPSGFDERSPSHKGFHIGEFYTLGLINGMASQEDGISEAGSMLAQAAMSATEMANDILADDLNPVITPVIDLTEVQNGSMLLSSMMDDQQIEISGSMNAAVHKQDTSVGELTTMVSALKSAIQQGMDSSDSRSVTFTQNNYSPKALSAIEIYRRTKNQISAAKGVLG